MLSRYEMGSKIKCSFLWVPGAIYGSSSSAWVKLGPVFNIEATIIHGRGLLGTDAIDE